MPDLRCHGSRPSGMVYYAVSRRQNVSEENGTLVSIRMEKGGYDEGIQQDFVYQR